MRNKLWFALACCGILAAQTPSSSTWKFALSGDSRNCGDIVMPAIASAVRQSGAEFFWHLGDFRAIYAVDEDMSPPPQLGLPSALMSRFAYLASAWPDSIAHQLMPFGDMPVFLAIGNHDVTPLTSRDAWVTQFAQWLEKPVIREQRLKDNPQDHTVRSYYHWVNRNVDFITLDNASPEQIDDAQLEWLRSVLRRDETSAEIRTIVAGMHIPLPGVVGRAHSMSDWAHGDKSGRQVYEALWHAHDKAHKQVYVIASHRHFYMKNMFETADWKGKVLAGWTVGTAGAVRYRLPTETSAIQDAQTDVYGYLVGTVASDGSIAFAFQKLSLQNLLAANAGRYPEPLVRWCFDENRSLQPLR